MKDLNANLPSNATSESECKTHWNASLPYPAWPFGTVNPKELAKWGKRNLSSDKQQDSYEEALM